MNSQAYIKPSNRALSRQSLQLLFVVQFLTVLPFMSDLPKWLLVVLGMVVAWRWQVMRGRMQRPPKLLVFFAVVTGVGTLFLSGLDHYNLDAAVAFCLLGYLLKSLEVLRKRDGIFQIYLGYFLTGVYFLYHSGPLSALLAAILLFANTLALQAVTSTNDFAWRYAFKQTSLLVVGAIPIMILGYLFFPRIGPLWTIPNSERGAITGMTDEITPGSVAELARSEKVAFRAAFEGDTPPKSQWYWRGNTLSEFDGISWRAKYRAGSGLSTGQANASLPLPLNKSWQYSIVMEPNRQQWLYFMDWPTQATVADAVLLPDARYALRSALTQPIQYKAESATVVQWLPLDLNQREEFLALPERGNEPLRQWAQQFRQERLNDVTFVNDLARYIRENSFFYTLAPPLYESRDSLADFWLNGQRGFCTHYASATAYILRSVGIPARLVGGYLGGVYNESANYIQVRQMEAHVWVEVWVDNAWQRFDPTASVAPQRVEVSLDDLFAKEQSGELSMLSNLRNQLGLYQSASLWWDAMQYQWQLKVIDYKSTSAIGWFETAFGRLTSFKIAFAILSFIAVVALLFALAIGIVKLPVRRQEPYRSLKQVENLLEPMKPHETIRQYFERMERIQPKLTALRSMTALFERSLYSKKQQSHTLLHKALRVLKAQKNTLAKK